VFFLLWNFVLATMELVQNVPTDEEGRLSLPASKVQIWQHFLAVICKFDNKIVFRQGSSSA
jgi:hypothetical protein